jgi:hypothetical protein
MNLSKGKINQASSCHFDQTSAGKISMICRGCPNFLKFQAFQSGMGQKAIAKDKPRDRPANQFALATLGKCSI